MIYFIRRPTDGAVKIGVTIRLSQRLKTLASEHNASLEVLAVAEGGYAVERTLHRRFAHLRIVDEWFQPGLELLDFIRSNGKSWDGTDEIPLSPTVRLHTDVVQTARIVAALSGEKFVDVISNTLRPELERMEREVVMARARLHGYSGSEEAT